MTVFANGLEISSKAQGCKVIAAFPDTCMTPPQAPPTPPGVPIPYPDFGFDSDLASGTGTVKIKDKEVSQENASKYSKCSGDEAGAAPKKGLITSTNTGAVYAQKWSMNVKAEGKGVVRFTDMATGNHRSNAGDSPPMIIVGKPNLALSANTEDCLVGEYGDIKKECNERGGEAHHIIPDEYFRKKDVADCGITLPKAVQDRVDNAKGGRAKMEIVAKYAKDNNITPDPTRTDPSFPSTEEGCAICVGGKENAKSQTERQSDQGKKIAEKGRDDTRKKDSNDLTAKDAAGKGGSSKSDTDKVLGLHNGRGHGYMHYVFDGMFGNDPRPLGDAVEIAEIALSGCAEYHSSVIDSECAQVGANCVRAQHDKALKKDPQPKCESITKKTKEGRFDKREPTLNRKYDGTAAGPNDKCYIPDLHPSHG
ncbi:PAAR-like domain-containing protein [Jannaschia seohaensis]|uniref:Uncharacterized protein DUF4150 n=1 Tax=Jannaschia seohaensis TaxID=475081 RepID=A0A2Y9B373_9RHOB|nr:PAAR-like domain-containing protein [Jannaschia seohaensis]PWJ16572.1 uncharacterized protein DUF4150 [Jannaschia seohaensis]SSA48809.1 protein of unknown function [Jannaschia seohaensis]